MCSEWPSPSFNARSMAACRSCAKWFILVRLYRVFFTFIYAYSLRRLIARVSSCLRAIAMFNCVSCALLVNWAYFNLLTRFWPAAMLRWSESNANYWFYFSFFTLSYIRVIVCSAASRSVNSIGACSCYYNSWTSSFNASILSTNIAIFYLVAPCLWIVLSHSLLSCSIVFLSLSLREWAAYAFCKHVWISFYRSLHLRNNRL